MSKKIVWILGSSGLTGTELSYRLDKKETDYTVFAPVRSLSSRFQFLNEIQVNFDDFESLESLPSPEIVWCCLGTTIKKAGSQQAFLSIDFELIVNLALVALKKGAKQFHLISSIGANGDSSNFYLRTKGKTENAIKEIGFETLYIYRPAALMGKRSENRMGERLGIAISEIIKPLLIGNLRKYRSIKSSTVAKVMLSNATHSQKGFHIFESDLIQQTADSLQD